MSMLGEGVAPTGGEFGARTGTSGSGSIPPTAASAAFDHSALEAAFETAETALTDAKALFSTLGESWGVIAADKGPLIYGEHNANRMGRLVRLVHVFSSVPTAVRERLDAYLREVHANAGVAHLTAQSASAKPPKTSATVPVEVRESLLAASTNNPAVLDVITSTLAFLVGLRPGLPDNTPLVSATANTVRTEWGRPLSIGIGLNKRTVPRVEHPTFVQALAAFYCAIQSDCISTYSSVADVTGAMLVRSIVALRDASSVASKALAALNTSYISRVDKFLSDSSATAVFDGGSAVAGFKLERISQVHADDLATRHCVFELEEADAVLVSLGAASQCDVMIFVKSAARKVICVLERGGRSTTVVPSQTLNAMLAHSASEALKAALTAQFSLARKLMREAAVIAASADVWENGDGEEDGYTIDIQVSSRPDRISTELTAEERQACQYAAFRSAPLAASLTLGSMAHLLHFLHAYRQYAPCRHIPRDFDKEWFDRQPIDASVAATEAAAAALQCSPHRLGGYIGVIARPATSATEISLSNACASGCACSCHQNDSPPLAASTIDAASSTDAAQEPSIAPSGVPSGSKAVKAKAKAEEEERKKAAARSRADVALKKCHMRAFEASELPVHCCPTCQGAAVPKALVFDRAGSDRQTIRRARHPPSEIRTSTSSLSAEPCIAEVPASVAPPSLSHASHAGLRVPIARAHFDACERDDVMRGGAEQNGSVLDVRDLDVASPHCTGKLFKRNTLGPAGSRQELCSHCAHLRQGISRQASESKRAPSCRSNPTEISARLVELTAADSEWDAAMLPGPADVNACTDMLAMRGMINQLVKQYSASERRIEALEALNQSMSTELVELRRRFAGASEDDDNLDEPLDLSALEAGDLIAVLSSDACKDFIDTQIDSPLNQLLFRNILQITLSQSPHPYNGLRYDALAIHLANSVRVHSNTAYKGLLQQGVPLPGMQVLNSATEPLQGHDGLIPERITLFKAGLVAAGVPVNVPLNVSIDGLALRAGIWQSVSRRSVAGYAFVWHGDETLKETASPELGAKEYRGAFEGKLAKHAEVVIIRDISGRHSTSIGFYPLESETGAAMVSIVLEAVRVLTRAGLNPVCVAWDGASGNRAAWRELTGAPAGDTLPFRSGTSRPTIASSAEEISNSVHCWFANPVAHKRRVYVVFDPEHVLKRHRNALEGSRPDILNHRSFQWVFADSDVPVSASWGDVRLAYFKDSSTGGGATFLSWLSVNLTSADRLNVGLAARVFSHRCVDWLRELGQRRDIDNPATKSGSGPQQDGSAPVSPTAVPASETTEGGPAWMTTPFLGNPFRATYTYIRTCRQIFDGTFQPVFIRSTANPALRDAWKAALTIVEQSEKSVMSKKGAIITHECISDALVTCASFYGVLRDYIEPLIKANADFPGLYGRALSSTINERYYGEMRGGRSAGFASGAVNAGDASRRDAILSVHAGAVGVRSAHLSHGRKGNSLLFDDSGDDGFVSVTDDTAGGTALSLADTMAILKPSWSAEGQRAAAARAIVPRSSYASIAVSRDPKVPHQRLRMVSYRQGTKNALVRYCVSQRVPLASWTNTQHRVLHMTSTEGGYSLQGVRSTVKNGNLRSRPVFGETLKDTLTESPARRTAQQYMLTDSGGGNPLSIDDIPGVFREAQALLFERWAKRGVKDTALHRPSLLLIRIFERMLQVTAPLLRVSVVIAEGAGFVQRLETELMKDVELRRLAHFALAPAGCLPCEDVPRTQAGSEDAVYQFMVQDLVRPFVVGQFQHFRSGRLAHELSASGPSSKDPTIASLRAAAAAAARKVLVAERRAGMADGANSIESLQDARQIAQDNLDAALLREKQSELENSAAAVEPLAPAVDDRAVDDVVPVEPLAPAVVAAGGRKRRRTSAKAS